MVYFRYKFTTSLLKYNAHLIFKNSIFATHLIFNVLLQILITNYRYG